VLRALGAPVLLHPGRVPRPDRFPDAERVHLYLDVSGSMDALREALYGAALDCRAWLHPVVHLFSTQVEEVTLADLAAGVCRSTGGTDLRCVTAHLRRHRVRRAVLITDGYVGDPAGADAQVLRAARLGVAYVPGHDTRVLRPYASAEVLLDANEGGGAR
jgi:predicted metal-dependent peptidase